MNSRRKKRITEQGPPSPREDKLPRAAWDTQEDRWDKNQLGNARPSSTFENFVIYEDSLAHIVAKLRQLAQSIVEKQARILTEEYPFDHARLIILWGRPGVGKTHLVEALINYLREQAPAVLGRVFLSRSNFTHDNMTFGARYASKPIVIIDDIFVDHHSVYELHPKTDIAAIVNFVRETYEKRRLVIATSNFPFKGDILDKVREVDETGRVVSRLKELLAHSGEIQVVGKDYREALAGERNDDLFQV